MTSPTDSPKVRRWSRTTVTEVEEALRAGQSVAVIAASLGISYSAVRGLIFRHGLSGIARVGRRARD